MPQRSHRMLPLSFSCRPSFSVLRREWRVGRTRFQRRDRREEGFSTLRQQGCVRVNFKLRRPSARWRPLVAQTRKEVVNSGAPSQYCNTSHVYLTPSSSRSQTWRHVSTNSGHRILVFRSLWVTDCSHAAIGTPPRVRDAERLAREAVEITIAMFAKAASSASRSPFRLTVPDQHWSRPE